MHATTPDHDESVTRPEVLVEHIRDLDLPDLVIICVKDYDLANVCMQLRAVIDQHTIVMAMMNGVDIYDRIRSVIPENPILPACVYVASHIRDKGVVVHKGKSGKLYFGRDPLNLSLDINWIIDLFRESGINFEFSESALTAIWAKFLFIAGFGLVTAKHNSSFGKLLDDELQHNEAKCIMEEIMLIAQSKGIELQPGLIGKTFERAAGFPADTPTSLQLDINSRKTNSELELFAGAIIKYGEDEQIETPATLKIYQEIKAIIKTS